MHRQVTHMACSSGFASVCASTSMLVLSWRWPRQKATSWRKRAEESFRAAHATRHANCVCKGVATSKPISCHTLFSYTPCNRAWLASSPSTFLKENMTRYFSGKEVEGSMSLHCREAMEVSVAWTSMGKTMNGFLKNNCENKLEILGCK